MTSAKRTPGKWRVSQDVATRIDVVGEGSVATKMRTGRGTICGMSGTHPEDEANAAFIVLACNSHDELRSAISGLLVGLMMDHPSLAIGLNNWPPVVAARAILAKSDPAISMSYPAERGVPAPGPGVAEVHDVPVEDEDQT